MGNTTNDIMQDFSQAETGRIYDIQKRVYWETDFVNRCIDRKIECIGLCNLPYESLDDEKEILNEAYDIY